MLLANLEDSQLQPRSSPAAPGPEGGPTWGPRRKAEPDTKQRTPHGAWSWLKERTRRHLLSLPDSRPLTLMTLLPLHRSSAQPCPHSSPPDPRVHLGREDGSAPLRPPCPWKKGEPRLPLLHKQLLAAPAPALFSCDVSWALSSSPELVLASIPFLFSTTTRLSYLCADNLFVTKYWRLPLNH